jgi:putative aminopeptidase FrvX
MLTERKLFNLLIRLVSHTTPHGYERKLERYLPQGGEWDEADNYIMKVGEDSKTLFCCHLDTVGSKYVKTKPQVD